MFMGVLYNDCILCILFCINKCGLYASIVLTFYIELVVYLLVPCVVC